MYKELKINSFRQFENIDIFLGKYITIFSGRNTTGKSTLLGLLANSGEIKMKEGKTLFGRPFKSEFSEILNGSKNFDPSKSQRFRITISKENGEVVDYRDFRTSWQKKSNGEDRFRVIPSKKDSNGKTTAKKFEIPVLYLGLSRLYPIGESNEMNIDSKKVNFNSEEENKWFVEKYKNILSIWDDIRDVDNYTIKETSRKKGIGVETDKYDYLTNSAGQDNIGQILIAILSFKRLRENHKDNWNGGLLLIDEIDATLHPSAQKKLVKLLISEAKENHYQVVCTSHSTDLLRYICEKIRFQDEVNNNIELYYFSNANEKLDIVRSPDFNMIRNDLNIQSNVQNRNEIKVYSEDKETRWFLKQLIPDYMNYLKLMDVSLGCHELITLLYADMEYFGNTLIVFDGDVELAKEIKGNNKLIKKLNNLIVLPGGKSPEAVIYEYLINLPSDHEYWEVSRKLGLTKIYFKEHGPNSYSKGMDREKNKKWFNDHLTYFESTHLIDYWKKDNKELVEKFKSKFIEQYNTVAKRNMKPLIEVNMDCEEKDDH